MSTGGYKKGSPDADEEFNVIPGNMITMKGVPHPVLGLGVDDDGNAGQAQLMVPGKDYVYPRSTTKVVEIPFGKKSVLTADNIGDKNDYARKHRLRKSGKLTGGELIDNILLTKMLHAVSGMENPVPAGMDPTLMDEGGNLLADMVPVQLEKDEIGEKIIWPTGHITTTNAKTKHSRMDPDEVTDVLGDVYVGSERIVVKREDLEEAKLVYPLFYLDENGFPHSDLKSVELADRLLKDANKASIAQILDNIDKGIELPTGREHIEVITREENLNARKPLLSLVKLMNEAGKVGQMDVQSYACGGKIRKRNRGGMVIKGQVGIDIGSIIGGTATIFDILFNKPRQEKELKALRERNQGRIDEYRNVATQNLGQATEVMQLANLFQDPTVDTPDLSAAIREARASGNVYDDDPSAAQYANIIRGGTNAALESLYANSSSATRAAALSGNILGQAEDRVRQFALERNVQALGAKERGLARSSDLLARGAVYEAEGANRQRSNLNQQVSAFGNISANDFNQRSRIFGDWLQNTMVNEGSIQANLNQLNNNSLQSVYNLAALTSDLKFNIGGGGSNTPTPPIPGTGYGVGMGTDTNNDPYGIHKYWRDTRPYQNYGGYVRKKPRGAHV